MFSDAEGTIPVLTADTTDGFAFTVDVNLDGTTTVSNFSSQTDIGPETGVAPEPSSLALTGGGHCLFGDIALPPTTKPRLLTLTFAVSRGN